MVQVGAFAVVGDVDIVTADVEVLVVEGLVDVTDDLREKLVASTKWGKSKLTWTTSLRASTASALVVDESNSWFVYQVSVFPQNKTRLLFT